MPQLPLEFQQSPQLVCGVDEAGRGPLAGAVFAAAVILDPDQSILGLKDSKSLTPKRRDELAQQIKGRALTWAVAMADVREIDTLNILQATLLAMRRAVDQLDPAPQLAIIDGNQAPVLRCAVQTIVRGDAIEPSISAASILAKTARDADLVGLHLRYPAYRFDRHKGYPTAEHLRLLELHGPCPEHRQSFAPVRRLIRGSLKP
ncbi:MAG: ribonuclease HII [Quisquiliibacterium sp.]